MAGTAARLSVVGRPRSLSRALAVVVLALSGSATAWAGLTSLEMSSDPGDWVGRGRQYFYSPADGSFGAVHYTPPDIVIVTFHSPGNVEHWYLDFQAPAGQVLMPGAYEGAEAYPAQDSTKPGLDVSGNLQACGDVSGRFDVLEVVYGPGDTVTSFRARFEQRCLPFLPMLRGEIRFNADVHVEMAAPRKTFVVAGEQLSFDVKATALDGGPIVLSASGLPDGATFVDLGTGVGRLDWTPLESQIGTHTITFTATDSAGKAETRPTVILAGGIVRVPADHATIQSAIEAAPPASRIIVAPGTYRENLDFLGKPLAVVSEGGPDVTILDGEGRQKPLVVFSRAEGRESVLRGFTIRNGFAGFDLPWFGTGGGIYVERAWPTIRDNVIVNNGACAGTGIGVIWGSPLIEHNVISGGVQGPCTSMQGAISIEWESQVEIVGNLIADNHADWGGGIYVFDAGTPRIEGNVIRGNSAMHGGGLYIVNRCDPEIVGNLIAGNKASEGGGLWWAVPAGHRGPRLMNNTILDNDAPHGSAIYANGYRSTGELINNVIIGKEGQTALDCPWNNSTNLPPVLRHNEIYSAGASPYGGLCTDQTGIDGNISVPPLLACAALGDVRPARGSPLVDAGDTDVPDAPALDLAGGSRVLDGDGDGTPAIDLGAYEFDPLAHVEPCIYAFCPADVQVVAPRGMESTTVEYAPPDTPADALVACTPPAGTTFQGGTTIVTCTTTEASGASASCTFRVSVLTPPLNDEREFATPIASLPFTDHLDTRDATANAHDPFCSGPKASVWYAYTPTEDAILTVDTSGSSYNAIVSALILTPADGLRSVAGCEYRRIDFRAFRGETVWLQVGSESGGGDLVFSVTSRPLLNIGISIDSRGEILPTGEGVVRGTATCSRPASIAVTLHVRQGRQLTTIVRRYDFDLACEGVIEWQVTAPAVDDPSKIRRAMVTASAESIGYRPPEQSTASDVKSVVLRWPRGRNRTPRYGAPSGG